MMGWNFSTLTTTIKNNNNITATTLGCNFYPAVANFKKLKEKTFCFLIKPWFNIIFTISL